MQIKTIKNRLDNAEAFDAAVNEALANGWAMVKRELITNEQPRCDTFFYSMLYAELVKNDPVEEPEADAVTWQESVEVLRNACASCAECGPSCPMYAWCQDNLVKTEAPIHWSLPEVEV